MNKSKPRKRSFLKLLTLLMSSAILLIGCETTTETIDDSTLDKDKNKSSIVLLFENDVHCTLEGYSQLAGLRDALSDTAWTAILSSGDFIQGDTPGALSKGQFIIDIMKSVGYDVVTLGNHAFDYKVPRLMELMGQLEGTSVVCANFSSLPEGKLMFDPFVIKKYGNKQVAFIGLTTITPMSKSRYAFYDEEGKKLYDLNITDDYYGNAQANIDSARAAGADYVIALTHLGEEPDTVDSRQLIRNTKGIDIVLDAHTHSVIPPTYVNNKDSMPVLTMQTGTQFQNIGQITITSEGQILASLLPVADIPYISTKVQAAIDKVKEEMEPIINRHICQSEVDLIVNAPDGTEIGGMGESAAGDLVADAFRAASSADIGLVASKNIRNNMSKGNITYNDILRMMPYDYNLLLLQVSGETIQNMLKANIVKLPASSGQLPQVSGLRFTVKTLDHSVSNIEVLNKETGQYGPLETERLYTICTEDYCYNGGGLRNTLAEAEILKALEMTECEALVNFIEKNLSGNIGQAYAAPQGRMKVE